MFESLNIVPNTIGRGRREEGCADVLGFKDTVGWVLTVGIIDVDGDELTVGHAVALG